MINYQYHPTQKFLEQTVFQGELMMKDTLQNLSMSIVFRLILQQRF
jgi:hypothetical protein